VRSWRKKFFLPQLSFIEWFRGFTDAEGCFLIAKTGNSFAFRFIIKLHKDDLKAPALKFWAPALKNF
jgi:hypothetical protein